MAGETIYINGRFLSQTVTGVQRFAIELVKAFDRWVADSPSAAAGFHFAVLATCNSPLPTSLSHVTLRRVGRLTGHLWDQIELPYYARDGVLLSLCSTGPLLHRRHIVALHDAAVFANPHTFSVPFRTAYRILQPALAQRARRVITVSEFSRRELARYCRTPPDQFAVVYNGGEHILQQPADPSLLVEHRLERGRFVLSVGSQNPNKNFELTLEAFRRLARGDLTLVVAGGKHAAVYGAYRLDHDNITALGYVSDASLRALYENALCFVLPSLYEGFGIPPLEAMVCGCPVVVSDTSAMPEVFAEAALYCDPKDADSLTRQIARLADDPPLHRHMQEAGLRRAAHFTWDRAGQQALDVIREVVARPSP